MVREFYQNNKFVYSKFSKEELNECRLKYGIKGKLKWKE